MPDETYRVLCIGGLRDGEYVPVPLSVREIFGSVLTTEPSGIRFPATVICSTQYAYEISTMHFHDGRSLRIGRPHDKDDFWIMDQLCERYAAGKKSQ